MYNQQKAVPMSAETMYVILEAGVENKWKHVDIVIKIQNIDLDFPRTKRLMAWCRVLWQSNLNVIRDIQNSII